jgi:hypothetical protein
MAGVTTNRALTVEAAFVQLEYHPDHATSSQLGWLVVFIEAVGRVAVVATDAERAGDKSHRRFQLRCGKRFEDLDILEFLLGSLGMCNRENADDKRAENQ